MMTLTNLKQIGCLLCIAVLLAGCSSSETPRSIPTDVEVSFEDAFVVEGVTYRSNGVYGMKDDKLLLSLALVFPDGQHYYPVVRYVDGEVERQIYSEDTRSTITAWYYDNDKSSPGKRDGRKVADVPFHDVYFLDGDKIVFQKANEEIGINVSDPKNAFTNRNLSPILETLIREYVQPQEPEIEEQL